MNIQDIVAKVLAEAQGPVSKELVKGTANAFRTVVKGNSPVKKAILSSEHMLADYDLAQRPRGVNVQPGKLPGYFRAPGMTQRTQELADAIRQNPNPSLTERGFLKAHQYLGDTEGQRALMPMLDRMAAQDTMPRTPLLRSYWQGEIGDPLDQARAARLYVMHGRTPGSEVSDSTSLVDRISRENDLARYASSPNSKFVRPDGIVDVQPTNRMPKGESVSTLNSNGLGKPMVDFRYGSSLQGVPGLMSSRNPYEPLQTNIPTPFLDRPLLRGTMTPPETMENLSTPGPVPTLVSGEQRYGFAPAAAAPGQDSAGRAMHLPPPKIQPDWRTPDEMAAARSQFLKSIPMPRQTISEDVEVPGIGVVGKTLNENWLSPIAAGADAPPDPRTANAFLADILGPDIANGNVDLKKMVQNSFAAPHRKKIGKN